MSRNLEFEILDFFKTHTTISISFPSMYKEEYFTEH